MGTVFRPKKAGTQTVSASQTNSQISVDGTCPQVQFYNAGPSLAFFRTGKNAAQTAVTTDAPLPPGAIITYSKDDDTDIGIICAAGLTATVYVTVGEGE